MIKFCLLPSTDHVVSVKLGWRPLDTLKPASQVVSKGDPIGTSSSILTSEAGRPIGAACSVSTCEAGHTAH